MTLMDIETVISDYGTASAQARRAGFDGVEIAANGTYLISQFLNPRLNRRADQYGTCRHRLLFEIVDAVTAAWDGQRGRRAAVTVLGRRRPLPHRPGARRVPLHR